MKKFLLLYFLFSFLSFAQENFWSHHSLDLPIYDLIKTEYEIFYAVSYSNILRSTDYGLTWEIIYEPQSLCPDFVRLGLFTNNEPPYQNTLIVKQFNNSNGCFEISTNGGENWQAFNYPGNYLYDLRINSNGDIYIISDTLYNSTDNGLTWQETNAPPSYKLSGKLEIDSDDNIYITKGYRWWIYIGGFVYTGWNDYIYKTTDNGISWEYLFYSSALDYFEKLFSAPNNNFFATRLSNSNTYWNLHHYKNSTLHIYSVIKVNSAIVNGNDVIYTSSGSEGINYTLTGGQTWKSENSGLPGLSTSSIVKDSLGFVYASTGNGLYKSNFSTYKFSNQPISTFEDTKIGDTTFKEIELVNPYSFDLTIDSVNCSSNYFFISLIHDSIVSANDSLNIEVGFSPHYAGEFDNYIYLYFNEINGRIATFGKSPVPTLIQLPFFEQFGTVNIGDTIMRPILFASESVNTIIIDSVYLKKGIDYFINDIQFPMSLDQYDTLSIDVNFSPITQGWKIDTLVAHSNSSNSPVFQRIIGVGRNPTDIEEEEEMIKEYSLSSNYPNPFNPITTIEYAVPYSSFVTIKVFNLLGEEVKVLVNEEKDMGRYKLTFDGKNLTSGIYFYSMQAEHFNQVKKFILIK